MESVHSRGARVVFGATACVAEENPSYISKIYTPPSHLEANGSLGRSCAMFGYARTPRGEEPSQADNTQRATPRITATAPAAIATVHPVEEEAGHVELVAGGDAHARPHLVLPLPRQHLPPPSTRRRHSGRVRASVRLARRHARTAQALQGRRVGGWMATGDRGRGRAEGTGGRRGAEQDEDERESERQGERETREGERRKDRGKGVREMERGRGAERAGAGAKGGRGREREGWRGTEEGRRRDGGGTEEGRTGVEGWRGGGSRGGGSRGGGEEGVGEERRRGGGEEEGRRRGGGVPRS